MNVAENRTVLRDAAGHPLIVTEQTTLRITATLTDEAGTPIPLGGLTAMTLTLYLRDVAAQTILNGVTATDILNTGRATVHATSGLLTLTLLPADNVILNDALDQEWHRALIQGTYNAGAKSFKHEFDFPVRNVNKVS
jgi:hypothetical protein